MKTGNEQVYPSDLTDAAWKIIFSFFPKPKSGPGKPGRPACDLRVIVNGILHVNKTGCQWRMLPKEFGTRSTVYGYFRKWSEEKLLENIMDALRKQERKRQGREEEPSAESVDSQSVKSSLQGCMVGIDGGKKSREGNGIYLWIRSEFKIVPAPIISDPKKAVDCLFAQAEPGDLLVIHPDELEPVLSQVMERYRQTVTLI